MKLNRNNYEGYFILYLDNELSSEDRREVEVFASQNPDLKAELDILVQSKLTPDNDIVFKDKESLLVRNSSSITLDNYEEWLLCYIDNELSEEEIKDVERFIAANPVVASELNLLRKTKLQPEPLVAPFKVSLYRREEKVRVISIRWWRVAAAAVLLLGASATGFFLMNNRRSNGGKNNQDGISATQETKSSVKPGNSVTIPAVNEEPANKGSIAHVDEPKKQGTVNEPVLHAISPKDKQNITKENKAEQSLQPDRSQQLALQNSDSKQPSNNLPEPDHNPNVIDPGKDPIAVLNPPPSKEILTVQPQKIDPAIVTTTNLEPSDPVEHPSNKGFRGFLRKVTRTFEKKTKIKATDDDDRLLIAGVALKLN